MLVYSRIFTVHRYSQCIDLYNARLSVTYAIGACYDCGIEYFITHTTIKVMAGNTM